MKKNNDNENDIEQTNDSGNGATSAFKIDKIPMILSIVISVFAGFNYFGQSVYQQICERFYNIPGKYFSLELVRHIWLVYIIFAIMFIFFTIYNRTNNKTDENYTKLDRITDLIVVVCVGLYVGLISLILFSYIAGLFHINLNYGNAVIVYAVVLLAAVAFFWMTYKKGNQDKLYTAAVICCVLYFVIMIFGVIALVFQGPDSKKDYEFLSTDEKEYVVLSEYQGQLLVVEYKTKDDENYEFLTYKYCLKGSETGDLSYKHINNASITKTEKKGDE